MDLERLLIVVGGLTVVSVLAAYWMAAYGMLLDSRFGRVVFFSTVVSVAVWLFISSLAPAALVAVGLSSFDLGVLLVGFVFLAGAAAALLDFVGWLRGEWTTPPPPFQ